MTLTDRTHQLCALLKRMYRAKSVFIKVSFEDGNSLNFKAGE